MKINNLFLRILSSLSLILVLSLIWIFFPVYGMSFLVSLFTAGLFWEYHKLALPEKSDKTILFLTALAFLIYVLFIFSREFMGIFLIFFIPAYWFLYKEKKEDISRALAPGILGLFYIAWPAALFLKVFLQGAGAQETLFLCLLTVFTGDIFAWAGGAVYRREKMGAGGLSRKNLDRTFLRPECLRAYFHFKFSPSPKKPHRPFSSFYYAPAVFFTGGFGLFPGSNGGSFRLRFKKKSGSERQRAGASRARRAFGPAGRFFIGFPLSLFCPSSFKLLL